MPFQSEKQRRYLWANEPEIARDWTDTYGSGIAKALGGRIGFYRGSDRHAGTGASQSQAPSSGPHGGGGGGTKSAPSHSPDRDGPAHLSHNAPAPYQDRIQRIAAQNKRTTDLRNRAGGEGFHQFLNKPGPQLGFAGSGVGGGLGNWASGLAGSKIGGGLGSILFGPIGMLLGSLFGQGVGRRAYKASQTDEEETLRDIMLGQNTLLSNILSKKKTPNTMGGEGLKGIDLSDMRDKRSAKNYIDLDKSYSEFDTIPNEKYHGLNVQRNYMGQPIRSDLVQEAKLNRREETELGILQGQKEMEDTYGPLTPEQEERIKELLQKELEV